MGWWGKHRNQIIGTTAGFALGGPLGAYAGYEVGGKIDESGGITDFLFGSEPNITAKKMKMPSRNDVIMNVLNEQLNVLKKRQQGSTLGTNMMADATGPLASTALFGA